MGYSFIYLFCILILLMLALRFFLPFFIYLFPVLIIIWILKILFGRKRRHHQHLQVIENIMNLSIKMISQLILM